MYMWDVLHTCAHAIKLKFSTVFGVLIHNLLNINICVTYALELLITTK